MNYRTHETPTGFIGQVWHGGWLNGMWLNVTAEMKTRLEVNELLVEHRKMMTRK